MASIPLTLHIGKGDQPRLGVVLPTSHRIVATVNVPIDGGDVFTLLGAPCDLRSFAQALLDVADEACRQEDRLTDEPLPGIAS